MVDLLLKYNFCKNYVMEHGYSKEIEWQNTVNFEDTTEQSFMTELAWVVLCSGMKVKVVDGLFPKIQAAFLDFNSASSIVLHGDDCISEASKYFNNKPKLSAIVKVASIINDYGWDKIKQQIRENPIKALRQFPYVGPIIVYHLSKNIGLQVAKPDRHLVRIADVMGYNDVQKFCSDIAKLSGDKVPVVDIVFWRYATLRPNYYLEELKY